MARRIDAFAHILPRRYLDRLERHLEREMAPEQLRYYREGVFTYDRALTDLDARWRALDPFGADYAQVLVLSVPPLEEVGPPAVAAEFAALANDEMAELVQAHRERFSGFAACLPLNDVQTSLRELDRAVADLDAKGALIYSNVLGVPLDDPRFEPLFARIEELGVTAWLHPTRHAAAGEFGLWWSLGWPYETAAALARLVYSGAMERHPQLKVLAHHGAGMVPHFSSRLGMGPGYREVKDSLPLPPLEYFRRFYADTALFGAPHAVQCVLDFFGPGNVLFGTDMPLGPPSAVDATINDVEAADLTDDQRAAVFNGNAERVLGL